MNTKTLAGILTDDFWKESHAQKHGIGPWSRRMQKRFFGSIFHQKKWILIYFPNRFKDRNEVGPVYLRHILMDINLPTPQKIDVKLSKKRCCTRLPWSRESWSYQGMDFLIFEKINIFEKMYLFSLHFFWLSIAPCFLCLLC